MNQTSTWIKLYRSLSNWGWYTNPYTKAVFIHILLFANYCDSEFNGQIIKRGQLVTGRKKLAQALGMSERQVRTALDHLSKTKEISTRSTSKYTIITVNNYDRYQAGENSPARLSAKKRPTADPEKSRKQPANDLQTSNGRPHLNKLINKEVNNSISKDTPAPTLDEVKNYCKQQNCNFDIDKFFSHYQQYNWTYKGKPLDWKSKALEWNQTQRKPKSRISPDSPSSYDLDSYEAMTIDDWFS